MSNKEDKLVSDKEADLQEEKKEVETLMTSQMNVKFLLMKALKKLLYWAKMLIVMVKI